MQCNLWPVRLVLLCVVTCTVVSCDRCSAYVHVHIETHVFMLQWMYPFLSYIVESHYKFSVSFHMLTLQEFD